MRPSGGNNILTKCPFHKGGQERTPSFSVDVVRGLFHCFTCHEAGTLPRLLRLLNVPRSMIDIELKSIRPYLDQERENYQLQKKHHFTNADPFRAEYVLPEEILGVYEWCPVKLLEDGFSEELLRKMEIGYDRRQNRIMYPLRDMYGNLAGFAGGATVKGTMPKYKVYEGRRRDLNGRLVPGDFGDWFDERFPDYSIKNHDFLWNFDQVLPRIIHDNNAELYVVEGFKACLWMIQSGFTNTVALMGSYISDRQQYMLHRLGCTVTLFLDNDQPGRRATFNVGDILWRPMYGRVKVMPYPQEDQDTQPDDYECEAIKTLASRSVPFAEYVNMIKRGQVQC
jgi:DNA primase